ncbi:adenosine deaminase [Paraferrimonas sedimenticola]|uniref:Adenine deaminase n=1 Tax=Paraferrimonas sedimenticola TaxID=375674 RepID=A0AA37W0L8_9GAMM|nr:adenosine deaminase [Paraferrimonas sedimenticola]GLP96460.1 adenine deaminase [Paraferrimonas sedimenticola]
MQSFIQGLPKVELHLHIEGSLEPELMFELAKRNQVDLPYQSIEEVSAAYQFHNLQSFLDIYYAGAAVLIHEQDFYDLTWAYLLCCQRDCVMHTEIFFDPQTHTERGIAFDTVITGITRALADGQQKLGISSELIMCFLRHLDQASAFETLSQAQPHLDSLVAVGLDSSELGHPPQKFIEVFAKAREQGLLTVAHAGEEGPAQNISDSLDLLKISRVDHGVRCIDDPKLVERLAKEQIALTVCPLSNTKLKVFEQMEQHNLLELLRQGLCITLNSDDPAYFGGYMTDNFEAVASALSPTQQELAQFTRHAIDASFCSAERKAQMRQQLDDYLATQGV